MIKQESLLRISAPFDVEKAVFPLATFISSREYKSEKESSPHAVKEEGRFIVFASKPESTPLGIVLTPSGILTIFLSSIVE